MTTPAPQTQTVTFADSGAQTATFAPYDPSLGPLTSVGITVTTTVDGTAQVQNLDLAPSTATVSLPGAFGIELVGAAPFSPSAGSDAAPAASATLASGSASQALPGLTQAQASTYVLASATSDLSLFTDADPVSFTVSGTLGATVSGSANMKATTQSTGTTTVTLQYNYAGPGEPITIGAGSVTATEPPILAPVIQAGSVTTAPQIVTEADKTTGWSDASQTVQRFDPSLGRLEAVNFTLETDVSASAELTDQTPAAASFTAAISAALALALPGQSPVTQSSTLSDSGALTAGAARADALTGGGTVSASVSDATDLAAFTGAGAIPLDLSTSDSSSVSGPNDLAETLSTVLGGTIAVSYTYLPAALAAAECFAVGTRIATPDGPVAVEDLVAGGTALTASGRAARIVWTGRRAIDCLRHPRPRDVLPVRVRAHAFADGVPSRDVLLSPDHGVFMEGALIPVRRLIDGQAVAQVPADRVVYVHVELDRHDVLLADGLPAESYLDVGARAAFEGGPVVQAVPDFALRVREAEGCAPVAVTGPAVDRARAVLAARAAAADAAEAA